MSDGNEVFICVRCAGRGPTCCQRTQVFLTRGDAARIGRVAGDEVFSEYAAPVRDEYDPDDAIDPIWSRIFGADGRRRILAHHANGDCHFLTASGCRLELGVRPLVCRLYPYEYNGDAIKGVDGHLCPSPEKDNSALLLALLGMGRDAAEECRRTLYREIVEEFPG